MRELEIRSSDADEDVILPVNRDRPRTLLRRSAALLVVWLLAGLALCWGALPASANAGGLLTSDPDTREQVDDAPGSVTLVFDGKVDRKVAKVLVLDAKGNNVTSGPLVVENTNVTTQLEDGLPKGTYSVHYRVDGSGGQPRGGAFQFAYGSGSFTDLPDKSWQGSADEPDILRGNDPDGPEASSAGTDTATPGIEVTASDKPDRPTTQAPPPPKSTSDQTDDPGSGASSDASTSQDPSKSQTATGEQSGSGTGRAFLIGGVLLLVAVGGAAVGLYRSSKKADHS